jgi:hypothetical protein
MIIAGIPAQKLQGGRRERADVCGLLVLASGRRQLNLALCCEDFRPLEVADLEPALSGEHQ